MSTRVVLGGAGALIGFVIGGPQGAYYGWAIGSSVGNVLDPQVIKGPSLGDLAEQTSQEGGPIPIIFGMSPPITGNVIATSQPRIVKKKSGGKGGPKIETESVYRTYAIGVCEGPIGGFLRVWRNGKKVYDALDPEFTTAEYVVDPSRPGLIPIALRSRNEHFLEKARFFLGTYDQNASPDLEAVFGAGTTPSYRGLAYMVMADEDVTDMRGVIPQWTVQIAAQAVTHLESEKLWPWVSGAIADPRHPLNEYVYTFSGSTAAGGGEEGATGGTDACSDIGKNIFGLGAFTTLEEAVEALNQAWQSEHPGNRTYTDVPVAYSRTGNNNLDGKFSAPPTSTLNTPGPQQTAYQRYTYLHLPIVGLPPTHIGGLSSGLTPPADGESALVVRSGASWDNSNGRSMVARRLPLTLPDGPPPAPYQFWGGVAGNPVCGSTTQEQRYMTYLCAVARAERFPGRPTSSARKITGTFRVLRAFVNTASNGTGNPVSWPIGPCLAADDPNYDNADFWTDAYERALSSGAPGISSGWTFGNQFPQETSVAYEVPGPYPTYVIAAIPALVARFSTIDVQLQMPWCTGVRWEVISGALPSGWSLNAGTGRITGTATTNQTANFELRGSGVQANGAPASAVRSFTVVVDDYPAVISTALTETSSGTSRNISLGMAPNAGDLMLIVSSYSDGGGTASMTPPAGWTEIRFPSSGNGSVMRYHYKVADGSEGASITFTDVPTGRSIASYAFVLAAGTFDASKISASSASNSSLAAPTHTPSWGSAKNLWLAVAGYEGSVRVATVPLTDYKSISLIGSHSSGIGTTLLEASSLSPGNFGMTGTPGAFRKMTIAVGPP